MMMRFLPLLTLLTGCVPHSQSDLKWHFVARAPHGDVMVLPSIQLYPRTTTETASYVVHEVTGERAQRRRDRVAVLTATPSEVAWALPGALQRTMQEPLGASFHAGKYPAGMRGRLRRVLNSQGDVDSMLSEIATSVGQDTLVTWVHALDARPLTLDHPPGVFVNTCHGPVLVEHNDEPYVIEAEVGVALIASDGELIIRYTDNYNTVLTGNAEAEDLARDLATAMATEIAKVWMPG
jgi:hypothetical protein